MVEYKNSVFALYIMRLREREKASEIGEREIGQIQDLAKEHGHHSMSARDLVWMSN